MQYTAAFTLASGEKPNGNIPLQNKPKTWQNYIYTGNRTTSITIRKLRTTEQKQSWWSSYSTISVLKFSEIGFQTSKM